MEQFRSSHATTTRVRSLLGRVGRYLSVAGNVRGTSPPVGAWATRQGAHMIQCAAQATATSGSICGSSSVGRVPAFQAGRRGFESRLPLHMSPLRCETSCLFRPRAKRAVIGFYVGRTNRPLDSPSPPALPLPPRRPPGSMPNIQSRDETGMMHLMTEPRILRATGVWHMAQPARHQSSRMSPTSRIGG
jgi:hypothetical protein